MVEPRYIFNLPFYHFFVYIADRSIDQLWVKYSDGKFGFSVQKRIYQSLGGTKEYNWEIWEKFGNKVGWRKGIVRQRWLYDKDITFDKKAPEGHLPAKTGYRDHSGHLPAIIVRMLVDRWGGLMGCLLSRRDL